MKKRIEKQFFKCIYNLEKLKVLSDQLNGRRALFWVIQSSVHFYVLKALKPRYNYSRPFTIEEFSSFFPTGSNVKYLDIFIWSIDVNLEYPANLKDKFPKTREIEKSHPNQYLAKRIFNRKRLQ